MKKSIYGLLALLVLLGIGGGIFLKEKAPSQAADTSEKQPLAIKAPVIMVPGTNGKVDRFDSLIDTLKETEKGVDVLKLTVNKDDTIKAQGSFTKNTKRPIIAVAFEDGTDPSLPKQSRWLQKAFEYAQKRYTFNTYDYLGYSNGGLILTGYLENERKADDPSPYHIVTLGTPYNDTSWDYNADSDTFDQPKKESPILQRYLKNQKNIPENIVMYNIAGKVNNKNTDTTVPLTSVLSGRLIYGDSEKYKEIIVHEHSDHGSLVENPQTQKLIKEYLFETPKDQN